MRTFLKLTSVIFISLVLSENLQAESIFASLQMKAKDSKYLIAFKNNFFTLDLNFEEATRQFGDTALKITHHVDGVQVFKCGKKQCDTFDVNDASYLVKNFDDGDLYVARIKSVYIDCEQLKYELFFSAIDQQSKLYGSLFEKKLSFHWHYQEPQVVQGKPYPGLDFIGAISDALVVQDDDGKKMLQGDKFITYHVYGNPFGGGMTSDPHNCQLKKD